MDVARRDDYVPLVVRRARGFIAIGRGFTSASHWRDSCDGASLMSSAVEIVMGRSLAVFFHPFLAWRVLSAPGRVLLAGGYLLIAYVGVLSLLLALMWR